MFFHRSLVPFRESDPIFEMVLQESTSLVGEHTNALVQRIVDLVTDPNVPCYRGSLLRSARIVTVSLRSSAGSTLRICSEGLNDPCVHDAIKHFTPILESSKYGLNDIAGDIGQAIVSTAMSVS